MLPRMINVEKTCEVCDQTFTFQVDEVGFELWRSGVAHIQDAMPQVSEANRELLISATCGDCFDSMFPEDDEEYDDEFYGGDETDYYWDGDY